MQKPKETSEKIELHTIETYAVFRNIDKSILATNRFIEKFGYKFISISLADLEKYFSSLFSLPEKFKSKYKVLLGDIDISISNEFYQALTNNREFGYSLLKDKEVIFLKSINDFDQEIINNTINNMGIAMQHFGNLQNFVKALTQQFRLFKNGDINCNTQFQISKELRQVTSKSSGLLSTPTGRSLFSLSESEAEILGQQFTETFSSNPLTELAISNFNLSYDIADIKTKYITLMTCLESLFNQGRDQIAHTVSRHLALIISNSEGEFEVNYSRGKELYKLRSAIVHGDKTKEDLHEATEELQNKVRQAINYCLKIQLNKKQLFDKLNSIGFSKSL